ncbi:hypothetical protein [Bacillus subtilis]|uniref:hypothetical protein n=1 Tax=Bacillus subtilis TaxID=1423 RepID=UPI0013B6E23E|nr:hypothetical protein [Bacillus subtilis]KAF2423620.1 hypothetical protein B6K89_15775 [Bacillus subtilis]MEC0312026.1 hypothetical protein [Bacillus subtilis]MEC0363666.1 hypothetical protein [Bacillus subtilis]
MEIVINISNESIKEAFEKCGIPSTRENMEKLDTNQVTELIYSYAYDSLEYVIEDADPETFMSQKQYDQMIGSFSLDEFHDIADTEFREVAPEEFKHMAFIDALYQFQHNPFIDFFDVDSAREVFCHFLDAVLNNFLIENGYFTDDEIIESTPRCITYVDEHQLEFECRIYSEFERNNKKAFFEVEYTFSITDIESEKAFQTALSAIEDSIKPQIIGVYQNGSNS